MWMWGEGWLRSSLGESGLFCTSKAGCWQREQPLPGWVNVSGGVDDVESLHPCVGKQAWDGTRGRAGGI